MLLDIISTEDTFLYGFYLQSLKEVNDMLRSIKKAHDMILKEDPETAITTHTIRMWCKEGKVKSLNAGNKVLVDVGSLMDYITDKNKE